eukprot:Pgem_evm1s5129
MELPSIAPNTVLTVKRKSGKDMNKLDDDNFIPTTLDELRDRKLTQPKRVYPKRKPKAMLLERASTSPDVSTKFGSGHHDGNGGTKSTLLETASTPSNIPTKFGFGHNDGRDAGKDASSSSFGFGKKDNVDLQKIAIQNSAKQNGAGTKSTVTSQFSTSTT